MNPQKKRKKGRTMCICGGNELFTGDYAKHNAVVEGKQVCPDCFVRELYRKALTRQLGE